MNKEIKLTGEELCKALAYTYRNRLNKNDTIVLLQNHTNGIGPATSVQAEGKEREDITNYDVW